MRFIGHVSAFTILFHMQKRQIWHELLPQSRLNQFDWSQLRCNCYNCAASRRLLVFPSIFVVAAAAAAADEILEIFVFGLFDSADAFIVS